MLKAIVTVKNVFNYDINFAIAFRYTTSKYMLFEKKYSFTNYIRPIEGKLREDVLIAVNIILWAVVRSLKYRSS